MMQRSPRVHDEAYLATWIRSLPCLLCGGPAIAAHVNMFEPRVDKRQRGKGEKSDDRWALPLCQPHHDLQHQQGERRFWALQDVDPLQTCLALYLAYLKDDREAAERIIAAHNSATEDNQ